MRNLTKTNKLKIVLELQGLMIIYSLANIFAKLASGRQFLSLYFVLFYGLEIVVLGVYAILWQQVIKKIDLSVAYMKISVVIPVYGCPEALPELHKRLRDTLSGMTPDYEIILVNDKCPKHSWDAIEKICEEDKHGQAGGYARVSGA